MRGGARTFHQENLYKRQGQILFAMLIKTNMDNLSYLVENPTADISEDRIAALNYIDSVRLQNPEIVNWAYGLALKAIVNSPPSIHDGIMCPTPSMLQVRAYALLSHVCKKNPAEEEKLRRLPKQVFDQISELVNDFRVQNKPQELPIRSRFSFQFSSETDDPDAKYIKKSWVT